MAFLFSLLAELPYLAWPTPVGWVVWATLLILTFWIVWRAQSNELLRARLRGAGRWLAPLALLLLVPPATLFIALRLPVEAGLPVPGLPTGAGSLLALPLSAIPWTLSAGMLGPLAGAMTGLLAGLLRGLWDTHSLFTTAHLALLGVLFSLATRQRYRTLIFRALRQPVLAALALVPLHVLLTLGGIVLTAGGDLTARLDYAISSLGTAAIGALIELSLAGLVGQVLALAFPAVWNRSAPLRPSPAERSLQARALTGASLFTLIILLTLLIGDWVVAGNAARAMLRERMSTAAESAAGSLPFFFETGQSLAARIGEDPRLGASEPAEFSSTLASLAQGSAFFDELLLVDTTGMLLGTSSPVTGGSLLPEERAGLQIAAAGVPVQYYVIPPAPAGRAARVTFLTLLPGGRVLIARADLGTNPLVQPTLSSLDGMRALGGAGLLLDERGRVLYGLPAGELLQPFPGLLDTERDFYDQAAADGTRQLVHVRSVPGQPWWVVVTLPARRAQQTAVNIAAPLAGVVIALALVALISLRLGLGTITGSLRTLAHQAQLIQQGQLDHPLPPEGVDEIGQLRRAFESMRVSLRDRLEELNRLLSVSLGASSSLQLQDAVRPVLEAVMATGASAARIALVPGAMPDAPTAAPTRFALGPSAEAYAGMDEAVLDLAQASDRVLLPAVARARGMHLGPEGPRPGALLAVALRHEKRYYGVLWAAYDQPRPFSDSDVRFLSTLAGQGSLAIANALLFQRVEIGRQQLEAILTSTPDAVLVTDPRNRLLLANPAAGRVLGEAIRKGIGQPMDTVIQSPELLDLLRTPAPENRTVELTLPSGQTYLTTLSAVVSQERLLGRVCILRDVTHFKQLDALKSEFVATVSHDLRSPLTLMRGYATMLEMVGTLNEQQQGYVRKIITGVENMTRLVNNLLDLGRIELGVDLKVESVPVADVLERIVADLTPAAAAKHIALLYEPQPDLARTLEADPTLLRQALYNLVENAIKYTPEGGRVMLRARNAPGSLLFSVHDTGIGIPEEELPRLFEKFYRSKQREARAQHGSGLGLAIVRSIAERHGGRIWVESRVGQGSVFFLQVPLSQPRPSR